MIITLAVSPSLDVTYEVAELRRDDITRPSRVTRVAGGKALNVARVAAALGADVSTVVALGGPGGDWVEDLLADEGVPATVIPIRRNTRTSIAIVEEFGASSSTDLYEVPTALDADEWLAFADAAAAAGARPGARVVLSGSLPQGVSPSGVGKLLGRLRASGAWVAVDGSGEGLQGTAAHADLIKVNRSEAAELLGADAGAAESALALGRRFAADAVVTDGIRGGFAVLGGEGMPLRPPLRRGRFSAGSGDAFLGGLLAALEAGKSARDALEMATDAAERNASCPGQGVLDGP